MKKIILTTLAWLALALSHAGESKAQSEPDSLLFEKVEEYEIEGGRHQWISNPWKENWFVLANAGANAFWGDRTAGSLSTRLAPQFNVGVGKWLLPGVGLKLQFTGFSSKARKYMQSYFTGGSQTHYDDHGTPYWREKHDWWDLNLNAMFNLSRLIYGYEGRNTPFLKNQFIVSLGLGTCHTSKLQDGDHGSQNDWAGHVEVEYCRFFGKSKAWSLDVVARGMFYDTWWDRVLHHQQFDINASLNVGATYYLKDRGWNKGSKRYTYYYQDNANEMKALQAQLAALQAHAPEYQKLVFYIFYPNNYSGRDDAPVKSASAVNAIDYLAGGTFAQRCFCDGKSAAARLGDAAGLRKLRTQDVPTRCATFDDEPPGDARGYEMSAQPISLNMSPGEMQRFKMATGYFYAPIYEGSCTWHYRVDEETRPQRLLTAENYRETTSYQLNARQGLPLVRDNMPTDGNARLCSFADFYAAIYGNRGHIAQYTDSLAVLAIREILDNARLIDVQVEGLATTQDNSTGADAAATSAVRNRNLSHYRALTAVKWLKESGKFDALQPNDYSINVLPAVVVEVDDPSTRRLNAKLNRCARVTVRYLAK